jgi:HAMP domain-containing protein
MIKDFFPGGPTMKEPAVEQERILDEAPVVPNGTSSRRRQDVSEQLGEFLKVMVAYRNGDFTVRLPSTWTGVLGKMSDAMNDILAVSQRRAEETVRICRVVGREGRLRQRLSVPGVAGGWADEIDSLNTLIDDLVSPTTEVTRAVGAVGKGDLSQAMALEKDGRPLEGEFLRSAKLVNKMIEQLAVFTSEVTRVAREVGTEGKLGGQAQVKGASGVWKELTDSVNQMAGNLTAQVRNIAEVTIAVANGDLSKKITVDVRGEISSSKKPSTRWLNSCGPSRRKSRAWRAKWGPKGNSADKRSCRASPGPGRTSPIT